MEIKYETGIPLPTDRWGMMAEIRAALGGMIVGQSAVVPREWQPKVTLIGYQVKMRFRTRKIDWDYMRIWRIS